MNNHTNRFSPIFYSLCRQLFFASLFFLFALTSCKNQKKITFNNKKCILDFKNSKTLTANLKTNEFHFNRLNAKLNVEASVDSTENSFSVSLRIKRDSIIWMSISKLGIEGVRLLITKDSVKFITHVPGQNSKYFKGDYAYISKLLNSELDFEMLQSLLIGNSVAFYDDDEKIKPGVDNCQYTLGTIRKYKLRKVIGKGKELKAPVQSIYMVPETFKIARILFYEFNPDRNFSACFGGFKKIDSAQLFPTQMKYFIKAQKNIIIDLQYTKTVLNEEQTFPFKIPDNYEQIIYKEKK